MDHDDQGLTLTLLDTSGIQGYIFGSNRLQENIGASEAVYRATTLWVFAALQQLQLRHNVLRPEQINWELDPGPAIEHDPDLQAELIYAGGGNTLILFRTRALALELVACLTRRLLAQAPGLVVLAQHLPLDLAHDRLDQVRQQLLRQMAAHKQSRLPSTPLQGLAVTAVCSSSGLPAVRSTDGEIVVDGSRVTLGLPGEAPRLVSAAVAARLGWRDAANARLRLTLGAEVLAAFDFPIQLDDLGRVEGEEGYIAVVHADGNRMSRHLQQIGQELDWSAPGANRAYIQALRHFSQQVDQAAQAALRQVVGRLVGSLEWDRHDNRWLVGGQVPLVEDRLPLRPLVFGGDDVTFVCNGALGLPLAAAYLQAFEQETQARGLGGLHAAAGVSIVKMHYPFSRAYDLSQQLARSAKQLVRQNGPADFSALDWHFATSGLSGSLQAIRQREYRTAYGDLLLRPLRLRAEAHNQDGRYWLDGLQRVIGELQDEQAWPRNKLKRLREPLRQGAAAVETFLTSYQLPLLPRLLPGGDDHRRQGWSGERCIYFDAIELLDHYVPLVEREVQV